MFGSIGFLVDSSRRILGSRERSPSLRLFCVLLASSSLLIIGCGDGGGGDPHGGSAGTIAQGGGGGNDGGNDGGDGGEEGPGGSGGLGDGGAGGSGGEGGLGGEGGTIAVPSTLEVVSEWSDLEVDGSATLQVRVLDAVGSEIEAAALLFSSSDTAVATVDPDTGLVEGVGPGVARIEFAIGELTDGVEIEVFFRFSDFTAGYHQSCALTGAGKAWCWGSNEDGFLGDGGVDHAWTPVRVVGDVEFIQIRGTEGQVCGLAKDREVWCWGSNSDGSTFGPDHTEFTGSNVPVPLGFQSYGFESISCGNGFVCGLDTAGTARCWGRNTTFHELGIPSTEPTPIPTEVSAPEGGTALTFRMLRTGEHPTCGITVDDALYCWGHNHQGEAGIGSGAAFAATPTEIMPGTKFKTVSFGVQHACAITDADLTYCWGDNRNGAVGTGTIGGAVYTPTAIAPTEATFTSFGMGWSFTVGLDTNGEAWSWGINEDLVLARDTGESAASATPTRIDSRLSFTKVEGNADHACGLATDGILYCWGANGEGRLGTGSIEARSAVPTPVAGQ